MDKQFASQLANLQRVASRAGGDGNDTRRRDDDRHQRRGDGRGHDRRFDGIGGGGYDRERRDGHDRRNDYDRKRRREDDDWRNRCPGGGRGRHNHDRYNDRRREEPPREPYVPLADLVKDAAGKYTESLEGSVVLTAVGKRRHIALLFLTIDDLPHEHVWREWMNGMVGDKSDDADDNLLVSVICHAKYPERITSPWLKQRHLIRFQKFGDDASQQKQQQPPKLHSRRPEWGSIEITRGMIDLLEEGLRIGSKNEAVDLKTSTSNAAAGDTKSASASDTSVFDRHTSFQRYISTPGDALPGSNATDETSTKLTDDIPLVDRFIFVSESCLPVTTLKEVEMALFGPKTDTTTQITNEHTTQKRNPYDKSWVNARSTPNNGYSRQLQWDEIRSSDIPSNLIWKADQWIVLNRAHGEAVASIPNSYLNGKSLWYAFRRCRASDEMYFPTALAILGIIARPPGGQEVENETSEKCAGDEIRRRKVTYCDWSVSAKNPASFSAKDLEEVAIKARGEGCLFARKFVPLASNSRENVASANGIVTADDWTALMQKLSIKT